MPREHERDIVRVLISTDNHLGYLEKDSTRGGDSFRAFEEVLALAKANRVDMVLLGGDLFHDNKPTRRTLVRTMATLRAHCLGDDPVALAVRSNPRAVNYMDSCYAVSLPVFVIHGNHDDCTGAAGADALSALDILAQANLVTYFGKAPDSRKINVAPILLQKGRTKLALYGLGNIRDDVLYETWINAKQVHWLCPSREGDDDGGGGGRDDDDDGDAPSVDWFSLFVIHQNRAARGTTKAIADTALPKWLDYVVWGHEHDSLPALTKTSPPIVQPGSTVATSLSHGESLPKHVVMLEIKCGAMKHRIIPLQTVRNLRFDDIALDDKKHGLSVGDTKGVEEFLVRRVENMVEEEEAGFDHRRALFESGEGPPKISGVTYPPNEFYLARMSRVVRRPLIRLRVEYSGGFDTINPQRFGQSFVGRVASPTNMILFYKKRKVAVKPFMHGIVSSRSRGGGAHDGESAMDGTGDGMFDGASEGPNASRFGDDGEEEALYDIPDLVEYFLYHKEAGGAGLKFLELDKLKSAVDEFVSKAEPHAIPDYVTSYLKLQQDKTLEAQERRGSVLTDKELNEGFKTAAEKAALRVLREKEAAAKKSKEVANHDSRTVSKVEDKLGSASGEDEDDEDENATKRTEARTPKEAVEGGEDESEDLANARFEAVQNLLSRNPLTAGVTQAARNAAQMEASVLNDDEYISDDDGLPAASSRPSRGRASARRGRGQSARGGRGSARKSTARAAPTSRARASTKRVVQERVLSDVDDPDTSRPQAKSKTRPPSRRAAAAAVGSYRVDDDDDDNDNDPIVENDPFEDVVIADSEPEEVPRSRKRKAPSGAAAASTRPRSRARAPAKPASRVRRATDTIDLGDSDD